MRDTSPETLFGFTEHPWFPEDFLATMILRVFGGAVDEESGKRCVYNHRVTKGMRAKHYLGDEAMSQLDELPLTGKLVAILGIYPGSVSTAELVELCGLGNNGGALLMGAILVLREAGAIMLTGRSSYSISTSWLREGFTRLTVELNLGR